MLLIIIDLILDYDYNINAKVNFLIYDQGITNMKIQIMIMLFLSILLTSCGTVSGTLDATGSILEGIASDARSVGGLLK